MHWVNKYFMTTYYLLCMPDIVASALLIVNKDPLLIEVNKSEHMSTIKNGSNRGAWVA